ncbi:MAG: hypothetical protein WDM96_00715 [Lacunisphaera sp.]
MGIELSYDRQKYNRGGQALLGNSLGSTPALTIDYLKNFQDLTANPNYGRAYVAGGPGNGSSYESDRKYSAPPFSARSAPATSSRMISS